MTKQNWSAGKWWCQANDIKIQNFASAKKKKKKVYIHILLYFKRPIPAHHNSSLRTPSDNKAGLITPVIWVIKTPNDTVRWWCIEQSWDLLMEKLWQQGRLVMTDMNPNKMQWVHLFSHDWTTKVYKSSSAHNSRWISLFLWWVILQHLISVQLMKMSITFPLPLTLTQVTQIRSKEDFNVPSLFILTEVIRLDVHQALVKGLQLNLVEQIWTSKKKKVTHSWERLSSLPNASQSGMELGHWQTHCQSSFSKCCVCVSPHTHMPIRQEDLQCVLKWNKSLSVCACTLYVCMCSAANRGCVHAV